MVIPKDIRMDSMLDNRRGIRTTKLEEEHWRRNTWMEPHPWDFLLSFEYTIPVVFNFLKDNFGLVRGGIFKAQHTVCNYNKNKTCVFNIRDILNYRLIYLATVYLQIYH
jgi:hypothetical protein